MRRAVTALTVAAGLALVAPGPAHAVCAEVEEPDLHLLLGACVRSEPGAVEYEVRCRVGQQGDTEPLLPFFPEVCAE